MGLLYILLSLTLLRKGGGDLRTGMAVSIATQA